jgi:glycosyltransferase involved in cell wall biosynthesis
MTVSPDRPVRVGLLAAELTHGHGWAHYSRSIAEALARAGVALHVLAPEGSPTLGDLPVDALLPGVEPMPRRFLAAQFRHFGAARKALADCDLIHSAIEPYAPLAALIAGGRPLVVTGHGTYVRAEQVWRFPVNQIHVQALRRATLVCVSRYTAQQAVQALPGVRPVVIPNGVDGERFAKPPSMLKDGRTILTVGAVKRRKGVLELVRALAVIRQTLPEVRCVVVGSLEAEPDYVDEVHAAIRELHLDGAVTLTGRVADDELLMHYARADVFALPSINTGLKFEGFGLALLEAGCAGLPVIGSRETGAEDAIDDGVTGLLVSQTDMAHDLPRALLTLLQDEALRTRLGAAGRERARAMTWDAAAASLISLYRELLQPRRGSPGGT